MELAAADPSFAITEKREVPSSPFALFAEGGPSDILRKKKKSKWVQKGAKKGKKKGQKKRHLVNLHARRVDSSTLVFSLSSHRYPYIVFVFSARFNDS